MNRRYGGWSLLGLGAILATIPLWVSPAARAIGNATVDSTPARLVSLKRNSSLDAPPASHTTAASKAENPSPGTTMAQLSIPALGLSTPVIQGTSYRELLVAPGHYVLSVLPGENGTSVIAAHNATYFRHVNKLVQGDEIIVKTSQGTFWFRVTGHEVVSDTAGLPISSDATLDLEACDPLDALYFTPDRYIVESTLVRSKLTVNGAPHGIQIRVQTPYSTNIPKSIANQYSFSLTSNSLPMGHFTYAGSTSPQAFSYQQSDKPLEAATAAVNLWLAYRDANQSANASAVSTLLSNSGQTPYWRATEVDYVSPLSVELSLTNAGTPSAMTLSDDDVVINGSASYQVTMHMAFNHDALHISSVQFQSR